MVHHATTPLEVYVVRLSQNGNYGSVDGSIAIDYR